MNVLKLTKLDGDVGYYPAHDVTSIGVSKILGKPFLYLASNEEGFFIDMDAEKFMKQMFEVGEYKMVECKQIKP